MLATASCQKHDAEVKQKKRECNRQQVVKNNALKANRKKRM